MAHLRDGETPTFVFEAEKDPGRPRHNAGLSELGDYERFKAKTHGETYLFRRLWE